MHWRIALLLVLTVEQTYLNLDASSNSCLVHRVVLILQNSRRLLSPRSRIFFPKLHHVSTMIAQQGYTDHHDFSHLQW